MTDQSLFPVQAPPTTDHLEGVLLGKSGTAVTAHGQSYGSLPTPQEIKDLLTGLSGKQVGSSGQELTSGVDYWKNAPEVEKLKTELLASGQSNPASALTSDKTALSETKTLSTAVSTSPALVSRAAVALYSTSIDEPLYNQGGAGPTIWFASANPFASNTVMVEHSALVSSHTTEIKVLQAHGYRWANGDLDLAHGGLPDVPPGYSNAATNKYFLQNFDGGSGHYVAERLLNRDFTPTEHNNWVSVFTHDIKDNGWTPAEAWLKFYGTVSAYPEVTTDLNGFQRDILSRTDGNYDTGWNTWAQNMMAHGYSLTEMRSNIAHSDAAQAALNAIYQADFSRNIDASGLLHYEDKLASGWTLQQVRTEVSHSDEATQRLSQAITDIQGRAATENDTPWIQAQEEGLTNSSTTLTQIYQGTAIWTGEHGGYNGLIQSIQNRTPTDTDKTWIQATESLIGGRQQTYYQVRHDLAYFSGEDDIITAYYQRVLGTGPTVDQIASAKQDLDNGGSITNQQTALAMSDAGRAVIQGLYRDLAGLNSPNDGQNTYYQNQLASGYGIPQVRINMAHGVEAHTALNQLQHDIIGRTDGQYDEAYDQWAENSMGSSTDWTLQRVRQDIAFTSAARTAATGVIQKEAGIQSPSAQLLDYFSSQFSAGKSLADMTVSFAYGGEVRGAATAIIQKESDIQAPSGQLLDYFSQTIAGGQSLQAMTVSYAYGNEVTAALGEGYRFFLGRTVSASELSTAQATIASGTSLEGIYSPLSQSSEAYTQYRNLYADWGQVPPTDSQLQTVGTALFHLQRAWVMTQAQTSAQLQAEVQQYQALPAAATFQDYISALAVSQEQATDLTASMRAEPMMEEADTVADVDNLSSQGGEVVLTAATNQAIIKTVQKLDKDDPTPPCNDGNKFRTTVPKPVDNIGLVTSANVLWSLVNQKDWPDTYKTNGITWNDAGAGNNLSKQGLPYEAYVQQKLNNWRPDGGYVWLQDHRGNWPTFDHWNKDTFDAVSDKTLNTKRDSYQDHPPEIKWQIWADMKKMTLYQTGNSRTSSNTYVRFTQDEIKSYRFELAVRSEDTTEAQWEQICQAYRGAAAKMAAYTPNGAKPLTFEIDEIE
ncbi:hypothetical protein A0J51_00109 [Gluconobacter japonicus]|nr:hypothetical protein A0J51_00109 [Gluconobacter japonicus]